MNYHIPLETEGVYHVFNHGNGRENVFYDDINYDYFINRLRFHTWPTCDILAYNLLPNHFHLVIKVRTDFSIERGSERWCNYRKEPYRKLNPNQQFSNFFNCYTKSINKNLERRGSLFVKRFRKVKIEDEEHLKYAIAYVHTNAEKHGLINNFRDWEHSSYKKIISVKPTYLLKEEVLKLYGGVEKFEMYHHEFLTNRALL